jgi:CRISPR-associated protein Csx17
MPGSAGGANAAAGVTGGSNLNPWDYVLMLEGALLFAAACTRRLAHDAPGILAYPFSVRPVGAGYLSSALADEAGRAEIWMPLWERPVGATELRAVFAEGRMRVGRRAARAATDAARAIATFGVDRGIASFQRYGFLVRNGLAYFATPLGRFRVRENPSALRLEEIESWLDRFRSKAHSDTAPASIRRAAMRLDAAILALCQVPGAESEEELLLALAQCEEQIARSRKWAESAFVSGLPLLGPEWTHGIADCVEWRLARALASTYTRDRDPAPDIMRRHFDPVALWSRALSTAADLDVVARKGSVVTTLNQILRRRRIRAAGRGVSYFDDLCVHPAALEDIALFISGAFAERRFEELLWAAILVDWRREPAGADAASKDPASTRQEEEQPRLTPDALYALLKLCFGGHPVRGVEIPMVAQIHELAAAGRGAAAASVALRRLRASTLRPALRDLHREGPGVRRIAAALAFPLSWQSLQSLAGRTLRFADFTTTN